MNVLLVLDSTDQRDAVLQALDVCRNSRRFGIRSCVAALGGGDLEREFEESGASFYRLDRESNPDLNAAFKLRKIITTEDIKIVHSFGIVEAVHVYLATLGLRSVKTVLTYHKVPTGREVPSLPVGAKFAARRMDAGIVPSHDLFPGLRKAGLDTSSGFYYVPYGLDPKRAANTVNALKEALGIGDKDKLLGMSADFESKGSPDQMTVCKALPDVLAKYPKARFIFSGNVRTGGESNFEACLEFCDAQGIGDKVFFSVDSPELRTLAGSVDIFVYSASNGAIPMDVIDAMLAGAPLVVSDVEPLIELTNGGKCCQVFVRGDENELAQSIVTLLKNKRLRGKRASDAKEYAESNYSIEIHLGMLKNLYSELIRSGDSRKKKKVKATVENVKSDPDDEGSLLRLE
jgi:glycosyltransferase involved in cell wall biosynthesis